MKKLFALLFIISIQPMARAQNDLLLNWAKSLNFKEINDGTIKGQDIIVDSKGNTYVTGYFQKTTNFNPSGGDLNLTSNGTDDIFLAKYDSKGNNVWAKSMGGTDYDYGSSVAVDGAGNVYITGSFLGTVDFDPSEGVANLTSAGSSNVFLAKYDANGNFAYAKYIGGKANGYEVVALAVDGGGNAYVSGVFQGASDFDPSAGVANLNAASADYDDIFLAKYDANGNYVWADRMGGADHDIGQSIAVDSSGNAYVTGYFFGTADFDPSANIVSLTSVGYADAFLAKYDALGNYVYAKSFGGAIGHDISRSIAVNSIGEVYLTGYFDGTADFDPSSGVSNLSSAGSYDVFLAKYDKNGNYVYANSMGGTGDDESSSIALDSTGNAYLTGSFLGSADFDPSASVVKLTSKNSSFADMFLAKYDASGNYVWAKGIGGTYKDEGIAVVTDANGNAYVTGSFRDTVDFDPSTGVANRTSGGVATSFFAGKYTNTGDFGWVNTSGPYVLYNGITGTGTKVDALGNIYVTGYFEGAADFDPSAGEAILRSIGSFDFFLAKYDSNGNYLWANRFGGADFDVSSSLAIDSVGNVYITGSFQGAFDFDPSSGVAKLTNTGFSNIFIAKYDTNGNYIWAKRLGSESGVSYAGGFSIALDGSGNAYVTGNFAGIDGDFDPSAGIANLNSGQGGSDVFLAKYDANGNYIWAKNMGGSGDDYGYSVVVDGSGNAYVTGYFAGTGDFDPSSNVANLTSTGAAGNDDIFLAKYDANGNYVWAKRMGGTGADQGYSVAIDSSGNAYVTGQFIGTADFDPSANVANLTSAGAQDIFLAKYDANGNYAWAKRMGGMSDDSGTSVAIDANGKAFLMGGFKNTVDFDPSANVANLTSAGAQDIFLAKYDTNGNYLWANRMGGASDDGGVFVFDNAGKVFVTGGFSGIADFDPSAGVYNLIATNTSAFIASYTDNKSLAVGDFEESVLKIYPNPVQNVINFSFAQEMTIDKVVVLDLLGKVMITKSINTSSINVENLSQGMYIIEILSGDKKYVSKFIKD